MSNSNSHWLHVVAPLAAGLVATVAACGSSPSGTHAPIAEGAPGEVAVLRSEAHPLDPDEAADLAPVVEWIGDAKVVLIGEASHGTHEFYALRAELTKQLITDGNLDAVAIEGDWPSAWRVDRYVRGLSDDEDAAEALSEFRRFPVWMWRNDVVVEFVEWLRQHNDRLPAGEPKVGFYGIDVYSPGESAEGVLRYLEERSPEAAERARQRYSCLLGRGDDPSSMITSLSTTTGCVDGLRQQLRDLATMGHDDRSGLLDSVQNARVVASAGRYWESQITRDEPSWNVRDTHMADTVDRLLGHLAAVGDDPVRIAVWAHNSHLGDARATEMGARGEHNLGQLMRQRHGDAVFNVGFSTHRGEVTAVDDWAAPTKRKEVLPGRDDSYEGLLSQVALPAFALRLGDPEVRAALETPRLGRAIGVIYRPQTERQSHYFESRLPDQFDAIIHVDETRALRPLDHSPSWEHLTPSS